MTDKAAQPMDAGAREGSTPDVSTNHPRTAWALKTLVAEVLDLFPETPHEFSDVNARNTALSVTFDITVLDEADRPDFITLLEVASGDNRVQVVHAEDDLVYISLKPDTRTMDSRVSFDLADVWISMTEEAEAFNAGSGLDYSDPDDFPLDEVETVPVDQHGFIEGLSYSTEITDYVVDGPVNQEGSS